jgi:hypothetical protein
VEVEADQRFDDDGDLILGQDLDFLLVDRRRAFDACE